MQRGGWGASDTAKQQEHTTQHGISGVQRGLGAEGEDRQPVAHEPGRGGVDGAVLRLVHPKRIVAAPHQPGPRALEQRAAPAWANRRRGVARAAGAHVGLGPAARPRPGPKSQGPPVAWPMAQRDVVPERPRVKGFLRPRRPTLRHGSRVPTAMRWGPGDRGGGGGAGMC